MRSKRDFRGYTATAPLKQEIEKKKNEALVDFRGYTATAPLKLWENTMRQDAHP